MGGDMTSLSRRCVVLAAVTWLPLIALSSFEGTLAGWPGAFVRDAGVHVRLLLAIPLFLIGERAIERRFAKAVGSLVASGAIDESNAPAYRRAIARAHRLRDSMPMEAIALIGAYALSLVQVAAIVPHQPSTWIHLSAGSPTIAGAVYFALSAPLYRFLLLRWLWRLAIWALFLAALARAPLRLVVTHPDQRGGIAVLCGAATSFGWIVLALGASLAGNFYWYVTVHHLSVNTFLKEVGAFMLLAPALFVAPLLAFAWPLERAKRRYHEEYGAAAADFARRYDRQWVLAPTRKPIPLGSGETSTHADLGTSFRDSMQTRTLPITRQEYLFLFATGALPICLYLMTQLPLLEILSRLKEVL